MSNQMNAKHELKKELFQVDGLEGSFTGYHNGGRWNGWMMPAFEYEEAVKIMEAFKNSADDLKAWYDKDSDAFTFQIDIDSDEEDVYEAFTATVDGEEKKLYDIGSAYWTWSIDYTEEEEE